MKWRTVWGGGEGGVAPPCAVTSHHGGRYVTGEPETGPVSPPVFGQEEQRAVTRYAQIWKSHQKAFQRTTAGLHMWTIFDDHKENFSGGRHSNINLM
ncbi:hypothetical protein J6590_017745 [Homalodisca vitripennis]|nr:hypothetical protein J6590_017745 [Homalodisca vitripennis]